MHADLLSFLATVEPSQAFGWAALIPALISVLGMIKGGGSNTGGTPTPGVTTETTDSNMTALLSMMRQRTEMQNPLYEAVTRLAMGLMPTAYQQGISPLGGGSPVVDDPRIRRPPESGSTVVDNPWERRGIGTPQPRPTIPDPWSPEGLRRGSRPIGREY